MSEVLKFDAVEHIYTVGGRVIPSVTQLMQKYEVVNTEWFGYQGRVRGKHVHTATQYWDMGNLDETSVDPIIKPYLDAYKKFSYELDFKIKQIEVQAFDPVNWYAGTWDRLIRWKDRIILFDIKTGCRPPWVHIQLAAYKNLLKRLGILVDECYSLHLRGDGTYRFDKVAMVKIIEGWREFQAMCLVDQMAQKYQKQGVVV